MNRVREPNSSAYATTLAVSHCSVQSVQNGRVKLVKSCFDRAWAVMGLDQAINESCCE